MASEISSSLCLKFARALTLLSSLKTLSGYSPRRLYKIQSFTHKSESQGYGDIVNKFSTICFKKSFNFRIKWLQISNEMFTFNFTFVLWDRDLSLLLWIQCVPINDFVNFIADLRDIIQTILEFYRELWQGPNHFPEIADVAFTGQGIGNLRLSTTVVIDHIDTDALSIFALYTWIGSFFLSLYFHGYIKSNCNHTFRNTLLMSVWNIHILWLVCMVISGGSRISRMQQPIWPN